MSFSALSPTLLMHRRRLLRAEQQFFDSYCRGGANAGQPFVIPLDFFDRDAQVILLRWLAGEGPLDVAALEASFRTRAPHAPSSTFHANLLVFLTLVAVPLRRLPHTPAPWSQLQKAIVSLWAALVNAHAAPAKPATQEPPQS